MKEEITRVYIVPAMFSQYNKVDLINYLDRIKNVKFMVADWKINDYRKAYIPTFIYSEIDTDFSRMGIKVMRFDEFAEQDKDYNWNGIMAIGVDSNGEIFTTQLGVNVMYKDVGLFDEYVNTLTASQ